MIDIILAILAIMEAIVLNFTDNNDFNVSVYRFRDYASIVNNHINALSDSDKQKRVVMDLASEIIHTFNEKVYFANLICTIPNGAWFYVDQKNDSVFWSYNMDEVDNELDWAKKPTPMAKMNPTLRRAIINNGFSAIK